MKIKYFSHDFATRLDPKVIRFLSKRQTLGYGVFWIAVEILHETGGQEIELAQFIELLAYSSKLDPEVAEKFVDDMIECDLFLLTERRGEGNFISSKRVKKNVKQIKELSNKRREAGLKSAASRKKLAANEAQQVLNNCSTSVEHVSNNCSTIKLNKTKLKETKLNKIKESKSTGADAPISESNANPKPCLIKYGYGIFQTTTEKFEKLVEKFSRPLVDQELPEMNLWLTESQTPSARRYRKPDFDHYLFANNWLKDKKLKYTANRSNGGTNIVEEESDFIKSIRHCVDVMGITDERPNGFETWKKKETTDAN